MWIKGHVNWTQSTRCECCNESTKLIFQKEKEKQLYMKHDKREHFKLGSAILQSNYRIKSLKALKLIPGQMQKDIISKTSKIQFSRKWWIQFWNHYCFFFVWKKNRIRQIFISTNNSRRRYLNLRCKRSSLLAFSSARGMVFCNGLIDHELGPGSSSEKYLLRINWKQKWLWHLENRAMS